jgi:von Willebrand factor type A C-terminal domain/von Willebrand factor type A domain
MTTFTAEAYQNEYLPADGGEVNAVVTVTASGAAPAATSTQAAEIIIVDVSGSMGDPRAKLKAATLATAVAIDCIRDGVMFGVIAGNDTARAVYPQEGGLVPASHQTREDAKQAVARLKATGGTAIGSWLELADELFAATPEAIRHAILLTDGQDEHETPEQLQAVLADCEGSFQCDCRGVGTDWEVEELRRIATTLLGSVDIVAEPDGLEGDFRAMIEQAMGKATGDVSLRLWTPQGATVAFLKQVAPTIEDLTDRANTVDTLTAEYPTGAWGDESRDYHLAIHVQPRAVGEEMLAGRVGLMVDDEAVSQALIRAIWTDDEQLSTRINREVAHYTGQAELAEVIQEGLEARKSGDEETATYKLGRAVQLASASGNDGTMKLLSSVVDVEDSATGTVRLKRGVDDADEMALDTRSTKTVRVQKHEP